MKVLKYKEFVTFINEAKGSKAPLKNVPIELYDAAEKYKKTTEFESFISLLPTDAFKGIDLVFNKILSTPQSTEEFFKRIYSLKSVKQITTSDYSKGIGYDLFVAEPKGLGRGELFIAWLIKDAQISGGGESFDVQYGNEKFEVKDYSKDKSSSIRLGTKGKITRFEFWKEIVDTLRRIDKLTGASANKTKFDFAKYFSPEYANVCNKIVSLQSKWLGGEMGYDDFNTLQSFYDMSYTIDTKVDKDLITNVILRGPDAKPQEISIEPIHSKDLEGSQITLSKTSTDQSYTYVLTELRRLKYVRDPKALMTDINNAVSKEIIGKVPFVVFRPDGPHIETDFKFDRISQGSIKIIETRLSK